MVPARDSASDLRTGPAASFRLAPTGFAALAGFAADDLLEAYRAFARTADALAAGGPSLRPGTAPSAALMRLFRSIGSTAGPTGQAGARRFFETSFAAYRVAPTCLGGGEGFLTGYYEPVVQGSRHRTPDFAAPILARPDGFGRLGPGTAAQPYPARAVIEAGAIEGRYPAVVWVRDWVEAFFIHVQGSARVQLPDGQVLRLVYDGRNGQPYGSIGRILVEAGSIAAADLSLERVKAWIRANGQGEGEAGRTLMLRNRSYIFFRTEPGSTDGGPIGGAGVPLTRLRSIAVDRTIWPYGLPFWIEADLPSGAATPSRFRRLMVAQDTGSAILGPARADLFFGSGEEAGRAAGNIRHAARFTVLLPRDETIRPSGALG